MLTLSLNGKAFQGLLDSGADATVIAKEQWPSSCPLQTPLPTYKESGSLKTLKLVPSLFIGQIKKGIQGQLLPL
ncbi:Endogenous retrovirus group K member 21 Pro protein [Manis javanica]|nr:Endogenous retrovirus group K member 21 Pro protein [Manis javanica]